MDQAHATGAVTEAEGARPLRRDAERNRRLILTAARELFARRGLDASFEAVAREAGVGVGTLYRHFPNRQALIEALFDDGLEEIGRIAKEALAAPTGWAGLRHFMVEMLLIQSRDRGLRDVIIDARKNSDPRRLRMRTNLVGPIGELVAKSQQEGDLRPDLTAYDVAVLEIAVLSMTEFTGTASPDIWQRYLTIVLDGMRASRTGPTELPVQSLTEDELDACMGNWKFGSRQDGGPESSGA